MIILNPLEAALEVLLLLRTIGLSSLVLAIFDERNISCHVQNIEKAYLVYSTSFSLFYFKIFQQVMSEIWFKEMARNINWHGKVKTGNPSPNGVMSVFPCSVYVALESGLNTVRQVLWLKLLKHSWKRSSPCVYGYCSDEILPCCWSSVLHCLFQPSF